jgi:predicted ATP-dependent serine protease
MRDIDRIIQEHTGIRIQRPRIFKIDTADNWMLQASLRPTPKKLFGNLWVEGELSILYADTGIGKTILAVQIANYLCNGLHMQPFENEIPAQKVLYLDFELTDKQFEARYTNKVTGKRHSFKPNFLRAELSFDDEVTDDLVMENIEEMVVEEQVKILVVDNITFLKSETEKGSNALRLMKQLNQLKKKHGLSILVLAHTPKRDETRPITINDLYGSKMISNFIDGAFAMGRSYDAPNIRYIKQIKCRSNELEYHAENVIMVELQNPDCMTQFNFIEFSDERIHLRQLSQSDDKDLSSAVFELSDKGQSQRQIADSIGRSVAYVNRCLKKRNNP